MYDYEQIEDSLRFCRKKIYENDIKDFKEYSDFDKQKWEEIAKDVIEENKIAEKYSADGEEITYSQVALIYKKSAEEYISFSRRILNNVIVFATCILIAFGLANLFTKYVAFQSKVEGVSMLPTLENDNSIIIDKLSYTIGKPKRYDIVVFPVKNGNDKETESYFIKRIIALPGETININNGKVYINGLPLQNEKYGKEIIRDAGLVQQPKTLASDEYFMLGDNRNMSTDSRSDVVGMVKKKDIIGKAVFRIWPLNEFGGLN